MEDFEASTAVKLAHKAHRTRLGSQVEIVPVRAFGRSRGKSINVPDTESSTISSNSEKTTFYVAPEPDLSDDWWNFKQPLYANGEAAEGGECWWATLDILAGREEKKPRKDIMADVDEWLAKITAKIAKQRKLALEQNAEKIAQEPEKEISPGKSVKLPHELKSVEKEVQHPPYLETTFGDHIEIEFSFNNPRIRSRLEKLMGSNVVRITDRKYMIKLQERIKEDHLENQKKRIQEREAEEVEREKKLILEGKIPIEAAPKELKNHPLCKINQITKKILEEKKTPGKGSLQMKVTSKIASYKFTKKMRDTDKNKVDESGDKAVKEGDEEKAEEKQEEEPTEQVEEAEETQQEESNPEEPPKGIVLGKEEYEKLKYEAPLVKKLKKVQGVEEMYKLAEEIVGPLKHQKSQSSRQRFNAPPTGAV